MTTKVLFRVYCETSYGQTVHVVGNTPALGNWMPSNENKLKWTQLNWWETGSALILPATRIEYKFVIKNQAGSLQWESGENRILENTGDRNIIEAFDRQKETYNYPESLAIKVMSFNVRYDTPEDGKNSWEHRKDVVSEIVKGCDIFGLQEPLHHQLAYIKQRVGNAFDYVSWGRDDGHQRGEASPIFYRSNLFSQEGCGVFWLSETPNTPGSRGWKAPLPRICSWVKLRSKTKNAPPFFVFNTHLDYESSEARKHGLHLILSKMRAIANGLPCILTGDFNSTPKEGLIAEITDKNCEMKWGISLVNAGADSKQATFVGFNNIYIKILNFAYTMLIDYILVTKGITVQDYKVLENGVPDRPASDHCPIIADLIIESKSS